METNLTGLACNCKTIAKNILPGNILDLKQAVNELLKLQPQDALINLEAAVALHLGPSPLPDLQEPSEPEFNKTYLLNFYIDRLLHSSFIVRFVGMTEGLKWLVFQYVLGNRIDGQERHLLNAADANFPNYKAEPYPGTTITEQYILIP